MEKEIKILFCTWILILVSCSNAKHIARECIDCTGNKCNDSLAVDKSVFSGVFFQGEVIFDNHIPTIKDSSGIWYDLKNIIRYEKIDDTTSFFYFHSSINRSNYFLVIQPAKRSFWEVGANNTRFCYNAKNDFSFSVTDSITQFGYYTIVENSMRLTNSIPVFTQKIAKPKELLED